MNQTTDCWLVKIEGARVLKETHTQVPMVRMQLNTFDVDGDQIRDVSFHMPKGERREVCEQLCERFGVDDIRKLKGKWAHIVCPHERTNILGLSPPHGKPVMVMSRKEAIRLTRLQAN